MLRRVIARKGAADDDDDGLDICVIGVDTPASCDALPHCTAPFTVRTTTLFLER